MKYLKIAVNSGLWCEDRPSSSNIGVDKISFVYLLVKDWNCLYSYYGEYWLQLKLLRPLFRNHD